MVSVLPGCENFSQVYIVDVVSPLICLSILLIFKAVLKALSHVNYKHF